MDYPLLESFLGTQNRYFEVEKPFEIHWLSGSEEPPAGSMFFLPVYKKAKMKKGDQIHMLVGGFFAVRKTNKIGVPFTVRPRAESNPNFSKATVERKRIDDDTKKLVKNGSLREILLSQALRGKYLTGGDFPPKF